MKDLVSVLDHNNLEEFEDPSNYDLQEADRSAPQELEALLLYNGFCIVEQYGVWNRAGLTGQSEHIISLCKHRKI